MMSYKITTCECGHGEMRSGLQFAVLSDKLDLSSTKRRLHREKNTFYRANKSVYETKQSLAIANIS